MTLRRFMALVGFCYLLTAGTLVAALYLALWVEGASTMTIYVNKFHEQRVELVLFSIGQFLVPLTVYEIDQMVQKETT